VKENRCNERNRMKRTYWKKWSERNKVKGTEWKKWDERNDVKEMGKRNRVKERKKCSKNKITNT
jgi:hypothetical protein